MKPLSLGFIGGGFVGQVAHLANYATNPGARLYALSEAKPLLRARVGKHYGFEKTYATHGELLADPEVEAVVAVTRRPNTGPVALEVLKAGKHLITEKPMCHSVEQGRRLVDAARSASVRYAVGYMRRHDEGVQVAKAMLDGFIKSGELGSLNFVRAHCFGGESYCGIQAEIQTKEPYPEALAAWPLAPEWIPEARIAQYALFLNVYSHNLNLLRYLLGRELAVEFANLANPAGGIVAFDSARGYGVTLECGQAESKDWDDTVDFYFERGRLSVELRPAFRVGTAARVTAYERGERIAEFDGAWSWAFKRQADAFVEDVQSKRQPLASAEDALHDLELVEAIWKKELARSS